MSEPTEPTITTITTIVRPELIRTLSEHHWIVAERLLQKNNHIIQWAGQVGVYRFYVTRENRSTLQAKRVTYRGQEVVKIEDTKLLLENYFA